MITPQPGENKCWILSAPTETKAFTATRAPVKSLAVAPWLRLAFVLLYFVLIPAMKGQ